VSETTEETAAEPAPSPAPPPTPAADALKHSEYGGAGGNPLRDSAVTCPARN
jgi:hypothetical protein